MNGSQNVALDNANIISTHANWQNGLCKTIKLNPWQRCQDNKEKIDLKKPNLSKNANVSVILKAEGLWEKKKWGKKI